MEYRPLGRTELKVSVICLGTMTWGQQNTESEAHEQLDHAIDAGINFIDTAEMYPVPPKAETQGRTEQYLGTWLKKRLGRDRIILATKVAGPADRATHLREAPRRLDRRNIELALDASLKRLRTDYVDLYQTHWPDRQANYFGRLNYVHAPDKDGTPIAETLCVLRDLMQAGKIRHIGVCNETPWGLAEWLRIAEEANLPRIASIQNPYSLLNRTFEIGLSEFSHREEVSLLAYSPLAFGTLSGKYMSGTRPAGTRLALFGENHKRYTNEQGFAATARYVELAHQHGLSPVQMALAFVCARPFLTSAIIGATSMAQLRVNLGCLDVALSQELSQEIEKIHTAQPNPCP